MKLSKIYLLVIIINVLLVSGCTDVKDYYFNIDKSPEVKIKVYGEWKENNQRDTIKVNKSVEIEYYVTDEDGDAFKSNVGLTLETQYSFYYSELPNEKKYIIGTTTEGLKRFTIVAKDEYGKKGTKSIEFMAIKNLAPVAKISVIVVGEREIEVSAENSYDRDKKFGGGIKYYKYDLNGYKFDSYSPIARYKFASGGVKVIKVIVVDNDDVSSEEVSQIVNL